MPLNFTVTYSDRINDTEDTSGDIAATVVTGPVYFEPTLLPGQRIPDPDYPTRPTGLALRTFAGFLDTDGILKAAPGGEAGVRLWANDPNWELPRLQYKVRAELTDLLGNPVRWHAFNFDAPVADIEKDLTEYMPLPGQKFGRGPASYLQGGSFNGDGDLVLANDDGSYVDPITPADGVLFILDNADGTVTIG